MDGDTRSKESDSFDWNTEDELDIENSSLSSCSDREVVASSVASTSGSGAASPTTTMMNQFREMGFPEDLIIRALNENGSNSEDDIVAAILSDLALQDPSHQKHRIPENPVSDQIDINSEDFEFELSDDEEITGPTNEKPTPLSLLVEMGYGTEEASTAIEKCGVDTPIEELIQFITAARFDEDAPEKEHVSVQESAGPSGEKAFTPLSLLIEMGYDAEEALAAIDRCGLETPIDDLIQFIAAARFRDDIPEQDQTVDRDFSQRDYSPLEEQNAQRNKRKQVCHTLRKKKQKLERNQEIEEHDDEITRIPRQMIGFGVPGAQTPIVSRNLREEAMGPPYFYYENVACTLKGVWPKISRFLYDVQPEFVDSQHFCAAYRKRGYVHNLPIDNRFRILPIPHATIQEVIPLSRRWWPEWDTRKKLNCLLTCIGSAKLTDRIKEAIEKNSNENEEPPAHIKKYIMYQCKKWNLIWVGKNKVAPLEPDEMEEIMGFPKYHTRGISKTDRHKFLGNSFQVDTVAYHLSVLKKIYPKGINVLSLFSGIGGAEIALHRLGIPLKNVVSVEISKTCRNIVQSWWKETRQKGNLVHVSDVQEVTAQRLEGWIHEFGSFDLVIGGSPCNNLAGGNRVSRDGLDGTHSSLFYDYYRILETVRCIMRSRS